MKLTTLLICLQFLTVLVSGQKQNNIWYFGSHAGLDFNTTPPSPLEGPMEAIEGCASISDPTGRLLFFTNGITVWDRNHNVMPNGNGLIGGPTSTQAALIVPFPNSDFKYYIFTTEDENFPLQRLSYSVVDLKLNAGFGDVIQTTKNTIVETQTAEKLTAVLHANGVDVWIITHKLNSSEFLSYLLTSSGLNTIPVVSSIGSNHPAFFGGGVGPIRADHRGLKIVCADTFKKIFEMFDFDKNTGLLSNMYDLNQLFPEQQRVYGVEFSPNDSLLYISTEDLRLYQIQISSLIVTDLAILDYNGFEIYDALQLGPDNKIYMARGTHKFLDVINFPDQPGLACQYEEQGILLDSTTRCTWGLPAFAPYSFPLVSTPFVSLGRDTLLCDGETLNLNVEFPINCDSTSILWNTGATEANIIVSQPGEYWVIIESSCGNFSDTIQVDYLSCLPIVSYDLEACTAYMSDGSNMDYSEFTPTFPNKLQCADISASNVFRTSPLDNKHSCTPGVGDSIAMCISSYNSCMYVAGHQASLIMEVVINPRQDSAVRITGLQFYERAPHQYNWINGGSGPNNFPEKYGIRILKDGMEIFRQYLQTNTDWTLNVFNFLQHDNFIITDSSVIRIELLPYCLVGNGADVSAWDIDEIRIFGTCDSISLNKSLIKGVVLTKDGQPVRGVEMKLAGEPFFLEYKTQTTDVNGAYQFDHLYSEQSYYLQGFKNDDVRKGVTTLDLILFQKHLLGITPFTSLHQYIASDINHDDKVNATDLLEIRKLLLGMYSEFPKNTSWRFGYLPQNMNSSNVKDFQEIKIIENLGQDTLKVDFVGIKIGDVNGDIRL